VAHLGHDDPTLRTRQRAQRELVGERAGRHEHCPLLTKELRPVAFEALDLAAQQVVVCHDARLLAQLGEQYRVGMRAEADAVAMAAGDASASAVDA
jgi:hypothetical protein